MTLAAGLYATISGPSWDDLRAPASSVPIRGQVGDPDADTDGTLLFSATATESAAIIYQMPHAWQSTGIRFHIHWSKTTDAAGDVAWEYRHRIFNNNAIPPAWSDWLTSDHRSKTVAADQTVLVDAFPELDMAGKRPSCIVNVQIRRNVDAAADTYGADVRFWEADIHYRKWSLGTEQEYPQ